MREPRRHVGEGAVEVAQLVAHAGPRDVGVEQLRLEVEGPVEVGEGELGVAALEGRVGQVVVRLRVRRAEADGGRVVVDGGVDVAEVAMDRRPLEVVLGVVGIGGEEQLVLGEGGLGRTDAGQEQRPVVAQHGPVQRLGVRPELAVEALEPRRDERQRLLDVAEVHLDERQPVLVERQVEAAPRLVGQLLGDRDRGVDVRLRPPVVEAGVVVEAREEHGPAVGGLEVHGRRGGRGAGHVVELGGLVGPVEGRQGGRHLGDHEPAVLRPLVPVEEVERLRARAR